MRTPAFFHELNALFFGFESRLKGLSFSINPLQLALTTLAINLLSLALPLTAMQVYDRIIARSAIDTLNVLTAGVVIAVLMEAALRSLRAWLTGWLGASREHALYRAAMEHVLEKDLRVIERHGAGYNAEEVAAIGRMREFYSGQALITIVDLPFIVIFLGLITFLAGWLVMVPVTLLAIFCARAWFMGNRLKDVIAQRELYDEERYDFIVEMLSGIHTLKAFGAEETMMRRYEALEANSAGANLAVANTVGDAYNDGSLFSQIMGVSVMLMGASMAVSGSISMGALVACVLLAGRMMQPVQRALGLWGRFQEQRVAREKLRALFNAGRQSKTVPAREPQPANKPVLELDHVGFYYDSHTPLLRSCSMALQAGDMVAIAGAPGSGKSTLLRVIAGLYTPQRGGIEVHGYDLRTYAPDTLAQDIAYLPTDSVIFQGTIRDNLTGFGAVPEYQMLEIARLLGIDEEVLKLAHGYDTVLDNTPADPVAPGMKQRITLARALGRKPRILLFDHADRSMDRDGYHHIYRLFARLKGHVAMVIVSQDNNLLRLADKIYTLTNGELHEEAMASQHIQVAPFKELSL